MKIFTLGTIAALTTLNLCPQKLLASGYYDLGGMLLYEDVETFYALKSGASCPLKKRKCVSFAPEVIHPVSSDAFQKALFFMKKTREHGTAQTLMAGMMMEKHPLDSRRKAAQRVVQYNLVYNRIDDEAMRDKNISKAFDVLVPIMMDEGQPFKAKIKAALWVATVNKERPKALRVLADLLLPRIPGVSVEIKAEAASTVMSYGDDSQKALALRFFEGIIADATGDENTRLLPASYVRTHSKDEALKAKASAVIENYGAVQISAVGATPFDEDATAAALLMSLMLENKSEE